jgi:hypothetical protein
MRQIKIVNTLVLDAEKETRPELYCPMSNSHPNGQLFCHTNCAWHDTQPPLISGEKPTINHFCGEKLIGYEVKNDPERKD